MTVHVRAAFAGVLASSIVMMLALAIASSGGAGAATASMSMNPGSQSVGANQQFTITIKQNADFVTTGANAEVVFDPGMVTLEEVVAGTVYQDANFIVGVAPQTKAQAIAEANQTGRLRFLGTYFTPGDGSVPPGETAAFVLTMRGSASVGGTTTMSFDPRLNRSSVLDATGGLVGATLTGVTINLADGPTATPSNTPTITATPVVVTNTPSPTVTPSVTPGGPTLTPTQTPTPGATNTATPTFVPGTLKVSPDTYQTGPNGEFVLKVTHNTSVKTIGVEFELHFDPSKLELLAIEKGSAYGDAASVLWGVKPFTPNGNTPVPGVTSTPTPWVVQGEEAITVANDGRGIVEFVTVAYASQGSVDPGEQEAILLRFRARREVQGASRVELQKPHLTQQGVTGDSITLSVTNAEVTISGAEATATPSPSPTGVGTPTVGASQTPASISTVAGTSSGTTNSSGVSGLPNAGVLGAPAMSRIILVISLLTLGASLVALVNSRLKRRS